MFEPNQLEERFLELFQHSNDILTILELDGTVRYVSPSVERVLGYSPQELVGIQPIEGVHPEDLAEVVATLEAAQQQPAVPGTITLRYRHKQGHWIYLELAGNNLTYHPGLEGIVISARDISTQKKAEEQLSQSQAMFNFALEAAGIGIWDYNLQKNEICWSGQIEGFLGKSGSTISRCSFKAFLKSIVPHHQERVNRAVQQAFEKKGNFTWNTKRFSQTARAIGMSVKGGLFLMSKDVPYV